MSTPAIVLMTDPSRCNLGDVHYLVQALLEMQQMGGSAAPRAFCDHPAAAKDFVAAYTHAYPQLMLQDEEIPTPDHLHSLITNGQIGSFARPPDLAPNLASLNGLARPAEHNGLNPIVVLTLGSSQVLMDALKQSPGVKESIRLIDIGQDGADSTPVSIADAVAVHGLEAEPWGHDGSAVERPELDDIAGPAAADPASLAPHYDPMNLDVVETDDVAGHDPPAYEHEAARGGAAPAPAAAAAQPEPVVAEPSAPLQDGSGAASAESPVDAAIQVDTAWPGDSAPVEASDPGVATDVLSPQEAVTDLGGDQQAGQETAPDDASDKEDDAGQKGDAGHKDDAEQEDDADKGNDDDRDGGEKAHADDQGDDVEYPPVGSLVAAADVLYPALDQDDGHGALHELAAVILDDGMVDPDMAFDMLEVHRDDDGPSAPAHQEAILTVHAGDNVVTIEHFYGVLDQEDEDALADSGSAPHVHDSDL